MLDVLPRRLCQEKVVSAHRMPERMYAFAKGGQGARDQGDHRRRRRRRAPARHDRLPDQPAGVGRADRNPGPERPRLAVVDQPDAGRHRRWAPLAIGEAGAKNAGLLAAQILALSDPALAERVEVFPRPADGERRREPWPEPRGITLTAPSPPTPQLQRSASSAAVRWCWMLAMAAARLGFHTIILTPEDEGLRQRGGRPDDPGALRRRRGPGAAGRPRPTSSPSSSRTCPPAWWRRWSGLGRPRRAGRQGPGRQPRTGSRRRPS